MRLIFDKFTKLPVSRQRKYQLRKQAKGLCGICGTPGVPRPPGKKKVRCQKHLDLDNKLQRKNRD